MCSSSAPTGIGKTVAALYPALEHALRDGLRIFFVTAKTTQQTLAVKTLQQLAQQSVQLHRRAPAGKGKELFERNLLLHEISCEFAHDYASKLRRARSCEKASGASPVLGPTVAVLGGAALSRVSVRVVAGRRRRSGPYSWRLQLRLRSGLLPTALLSGSPYGGLCADH